MRPRLTRRQTEVLRFIETYLSSRGYPPSYAEIAAGLGLSSVSTVHEHVQNLRNAGALAPGRKWVARQAVPLTPDVAAALADMREARENHLAWAAWLDENRGDEPDTKPLGETIGDAEFHRLWVSKYDRVIELLRA